MLTYILIPNKYVLEIVTFVRLNVLIIAENKPTGYTFKMMKHPFALFTSEIIQ